MTNTTKILIKSITSNMINVERREDESLKLIALNFLEDCNLEEFEFFLQELGRLQDFKDVENNHYGAFRFDLSTNPNDIYEWFASGDDYETIELLDVEEYIEDNDLFELNSLDDFILKHLDMDSLIEDFIEEEDQFHEDIEHLLWAIQDAIKGAR